MLPGAGAELLQVVVFLVEEGAEVELYAGPGDRLAVGEVEGAFRGLA